MLKQLIKSLKFKEPIDMMYMANDGTISKRRIQALKINGHTFQAYCYLRKSKRTFRINNILALVPVTRKESMVI